METKTVKIEIPVGFEIDHKNSTFQQIVFKKIEKKLPKSWDELGEIKGYYVSSLSDIQEGIADMKCCDKNYFPSKAEAEAMLAMAQLCQLRDVWNNGWKPDWKNENLRKYVIVQKSGILYESARFCENNPMAFKTEELRYEFFDTFKDLLEIAKPFL